MSPDLANNSNGAMVCVFVVPEAKLPVQGERKVMQPEKIAVRMLDPENARVFDVCRPVRRIEPLFIQRRAQHLGAFENHLHHVLIAVVGCAPVDIRI